MLSQRVGKYLKNIFWEVSSSKDLGLMRKLSFGRVLKAIIDAIPATFFWKEFI